MCHPHILTADPERLLEEDLEDLDVEDAEPDGASETRQQPAEASA